jgi:hypothetical protein
LHYIFFSSIEIGTLVFIIYTAWKWTKLKTFKKNHSEYV